MDRTEKEITFDDMKDVKGLDEKTYSRLKAQYGKRLRLVSLETEDGKAGYLVVKPSRSHMMAVASHAKDNDFEGGNAVLVNSCVVAGDRELIEEDFTVYSALLEVFHGLTEAAKAFTTRV